jgi:glycine/D-amino acid oxidase-like deaminating enzyme
MWFSLPAMRARFGDAAAIEIARASQRSVEQIGEFCRTEKLDSWFRPAGYLQVSTCAAHDAGWGPIEACSELGEPGAVEVLSAGEVSSRCASPGFRGGAFYPGAATVQPARLALGLRDRVAALPGVLLFERSPVRRLSVARPDPLAETAAARIRARAVVLAMGAGSGARGGPLRGRLTVASSHMVITEPVPDLLATVGWTGGECITDSRDLVHYMRTTPDGRIAFGWGGGRIALGTRLRARAEHDPSITNRVAAELRAFFPGLEGRELTHAWGGPIDVSPSHLPILMPLAGGRVIAACGYTGNGVGPSHMLGRTLASLALDRRDQAAGLALIDPDPRRVPGGLPGWIGGNAIRAGLIRSEDAIGRGRPPDPVSRLLATIPELIGFHIGR